MIDIEGLLVSYLRAGLDVPVSTKVPNPRPAAFVRVMRTGGPVSQRVLDLPQVSVTAWAASSVSAERLADQVRSLLLDGASRSTAGLHRVRVESFYYDPDPDTGSDRYSLLVTATARAPRSS